MNGVKVAAAKKVQEITETVVKQFVEKLTQEEKSQVINWSQKAIAIRENKILSNTEKIKALAKIENSETSKILMNVVFMALKNKIWTNQTWARRLGFAGLATGLTFGGAAVGIATMGAGIGVPLMVMTAAGGVVLGAAIDEIKKEL